MNIRRVGRIQGVTDGGAEPGRASCHHVTVGGSVGPRDNPPWCKGSTSDFGSDGPGSNPGGGAPRTAVKSRRLGTPGELRRGRVPPAVPSTRAHPMTVRVLLATACRELPSNKCRDRLADHAHPGTGRAAPDIHRLRARAHQRQPAPAVLVPGRRRAPRAVVEHGDDHLAAAVGVRYTLRVHHHLTGPPRRVGVVSRVRYRFADREQQVVGVNLGPAQLDQPSTNSAAHDRRRHRVGRQHLAHRLTHPCSLPRGTPSPGRALTSARSANASDREYPLWRQSVPGYRRSDVSPQHGRPYQGRPALARPSLGGRRSGWPGWSGGNVQSAALGTGTDPAGGRPAAALGLRTAMSSAVVTVLGSSGRPANPVRGNPARGNPARGNPERANPVPRAAGRRRVRPSAEASLAHRPVRSGRPATPGRERPSPRSNAAETSTARTKSTRVTGTLYPPIEVSRAAGAVDGGNSA